MLLGRGYMAFLTDDINREFMNRRIIVGSQKYCEYKLLRGKYEINVFE